MKQSLLLRLCIAMERYAQPREVVDTAANESIPRRWPDMDDTFIPPPSVSDKPFSRAFPMNHTEAHISYTNKNSYPEN